MKKPWELTREEARSFWEMNSERLIKEQGQLAPWRAFGMVGPGSVARMCIEQQWFIREVKAGRFFAQIDPYHRASVVKALEEGEFVPAKVLADYPNLMSDKPKGGAK